MLRGKFTRHFDARMPKMTQSEPSFLESYHPIKVNSRTRERKGLVFLFLKRFFDTSNASLAVNLPPRDERIWT